MRIFLVDGKTCLSFIGKLPSDNTGSGFYFGSLFWPEQLSINTVVLRQHLSQQHGGIFSFINTMDWTEQWQDCFGTFRLRLLGVTAAIYRLLRNNNSTDLFDSLCKRQQKW